MTLNYWGYNTESWAPFQYKGYGDSHVWPSYLEHGDPYAGKTTSLYWDGPLIHVMKHHYHHYHYFCQYHINTGHQLRYCFLAALWLKKYPLKKLLTDSEICDKPIYAINDLLYKAPNWTLISFDGVMSWSTLLLWSIVFIMKVSQVNDKMRFHNAFCIYGNLLTHK